MLGYGRRTTAYNSSITSKQSPSIVALRPGNPREVSLTDSIAYFALLCRQVDAATDIGILEATEPAKLSIALSTAKQTDSGLPSYQKANSHNGLCRKPPHCSSLHAQPGPSGSFKSTDQLACPWANGHTP